MSKANNTQVGGNHYKTKMEHWDYVVANDLGYFEGQITKYVTRHRKKNGLEDLHKARHFLDKLIEVEKERIFDFEQAKLGMGSVDGGNPGGGYVNQ